MVMSSGYQAWVDAVAALTQPEEVIWCDGSQEEWDILTHLLLAKGSIIKLNESKRPNSYLARTHESDVARVEDRTFICSKNQEDAGPTNNWMDPLEMRDLLGKKFDSSMRGRKMYVVPFSMGPIDSSAAKFGIEITDSPFVVLNMHLMNRVSKTVLEKIVAGADWVPALHSVGSPLVDENQVKISDSPWPCNQEKYIVHFPESREIISYGSGYGGNALLGKKCMSLRIGSVLGRDEGWLAEHMLLIKVTSPEGKSYHIAAAFPSACGKTNLAMLTPTLPGWKVSTLGDDITWISPDKNGRLRAMNPEAGFFGVAPGTGVATNPVAVETLRANTIFTNVALTEDNDVWWEGLTLEVPENLTDWQGKKWSKDAGRVAAHPNSRFTVALEQCPSIDPAWDSLDGVELDAILFGGRRATNVPLVVQSRDWEHGVFMGATIASEQTAAAEGVIGILRRDPFAMLPFCGYNMADYWGNWLKIGKAIDDSKLPKIFQVNWFRKDKNGNFMWPGFGENIRVLDWIINRLEDKVDFEDSPIGLLPKLDQFNTEGLSLSAEKMEEMFMVDKSSWLAEADLIQVFFRKFKNRLPLPISKQLRNLKLRLN